MDLNKIEEIKKIAIIAMFSDDYLMETLVLKGGNALDIIYKIANRSSIDLDFSMVNDVECIDVFFGRIRKSLERSFLAYGYKAFDINIEPRPRIVSKNIPDFWGGYDVTFKIIKKEQYDQYQNSIDELRKRASVVSVGYKKIFNIQISKHEFCEHKQKFDLGGCTIYAYSPEMIVFEKLRSLCQQMQEYKYRKHTASARARDFFDIFTVLSTFKEIDLTTADNLDLLQRIFKAKDVPINLLKRIREYKEFHRSDFSSVQDTVKLNVRLR